MTDEALNNKATDSIEHPQAPKMHPWDPIVGSHASFLNDLECISEMVSLVLPVLKNRDEERNQRIKQITEEIEGEQGKGRRLKSATDIQEFIGHIKKMRQGDHMFRQGVITSIVSKFDEFIIDVLKSSYRLNTGWLKNPDRNISYKELLEIESLDLLKDEIISKEIDGLMRNSHHAQITFLDSRLKIGIEHEFPYWLDFLEITERRNLFVHTGGTVSPQYIDNCKRWNVSIDEKIKEGVRLSASDKYIQKAIDCFYELCVRVAQASIRRMFPASFEDADGRLNNNSVDLLIEERWELAERIFDFALSIPENLSSNGEFKYYFLLNRCIAKKFSGKSFVEDLHSIDWTPFHPKYHFAVAILEDRFDDAVILMRTKAVQDEVTEQHFKEWPLLKEFRKTDLFQSTFKDIFGKDYNKELLVEAEREIQAQQGAALDGDSAALHPRQ
jgi:hypothetical protein